MDEVNTVGAMGDPSDDPVLGSDGYPHTIEIARIKTWPVQSMADLRGLLEYVRRRWKYDDMMWAESDETDDMLGGRRYREYRMSTGGWSGNEDLVGALEVREVPALAQDDEPGAGDRVGDVLGARHRVEVVLSMNHQRRNASRFSEL